MIVRENTTTNISDTYAQRRKIKKQGKNFSPPKIFRTKACEI
jgi:hypothetical protein